VCDSGTELKTLPSERIFKERTGIASGEWAPDGDFGIADWGGGRGIGAVFSFLVRGGVFVDDGPTPSVIN